MSRTEKCLKKIATNLGVNCVAEENTVCEVLNKIADSMELKVIDVYDLYGDESELHPLYRMIDDDYGNKIGVLDLTKPGEYLITNTEDTGFAELGVNELHIICGRMFNLDYAKTITTNAHTDIFASIDPEHSDGLMIGVSEDWFNQFLSQPLLIKVTPTSVHLSQAYEV